MKKASIVLLLLFVLVISSISLSFKLAGAVNSESLFSDDFNGSSVDPNKWVVEKNTGKSGEPAYGGSVNVADGKISLTSDGSTFPFICSAVNPFPETGDFAIEFKFTYTRIAHWGAGIWISGEPFIYDSTPLPTNPVFRNSIFRLWAGDENTYGKAGVWVFLLGELVVHQEVLEVYADVPQSPITHTFRLEYAQGVYSLMIDGIEVASAPSQLRPSTIGFGHPPVDYIPFPTYVVSARIWDSFNIDYIKMLRTSRISMETSTAATQLGFRVDISGTLRSQTEEPLPSANVILSYQINGVKTWNPISSVTTDVNGSYSATWIPTATGNFAIKAHWQGDDEYAGTYEVRNISVLQDKGQNVFLAESNSTLSTLSFDSTKNEVSFSVSGESGTNGYVRFLIPKALLNESAVTVYLDGQPIQYDTTTLDDQQVFYFTYHHSSHDVLFKMSDSQGSGLPSLPDVSAVQDFPWWIILPVLAFSALLIFFVVKRRNRNQSPSQVH